MATNQRDELTAQLLDKVRRDASLKQELLASPKAVVKNVLDIDVPDSVDLTVLEESANKRYIVLPFEDKQLEGELSDEMLEMVAGGTTYKLHNKNT